MSNRMLLVVVVVCLGFLAVAGQADAAVTVQNWAQLVYRSSPVVAQAFVYSSTDSAVLRIMYGPSMRMAKWVRNEQSGDTSDYQVRVNKGDIITVVIDAWNDLTQTDSTAHHVVVYDTFALLPFYQYGNTGCLVGPDNGVNSFTYVTGSETYAQGNSYAIPAKIAYYDSVAGWVGTGGATVDINDPNDADWITYNGSRETNGATALSNISRLTGIAWYWTQVYSAWDENSGYPTQNPGARYMTRVQFQVKKNNN